MVPPDVSILSESLQMPPCLTHLLSICNHVMEPGVSRPPFLAFPLGVHVCDYLVVLDAALQKVWPFHRQDLNRSTGCCFVLPQNSSLEILSGQRILRTFLWHVLMKNCIFFMVVTVIHQVSAP
ncbi:hypothetical protein DPMN_158871 [Dreissena polymorpha]|uniref:Uncharacterized protein n=1 Tax=Dreissena polymorpha TaxID=45954 RepID=A0A9D4EM70_DREPO|nr:hypothetical protein DPMN_158871 [Dreissena polymorpha]